MRNAIGLFKLIAGQIHRVMKTRRTCPVCSWTGHFFFIGGIDDKQRFDCRCPNCESLERHRLAYLVATQQRELDFTRVLHVAPEKQLSKWLRSHASEYLSIDLYNSAMAKMDITCLDLESESQTLVWASHVLEHVINDKKAISEIHRVLVPGGHAFIQVPIWRPATYEELSITAPDERLKYFYQKDHVRLYGLDIVDRFEALGFKGAIVRAQDFGPDRLVTNGLSFASTNEVFLFKKMS